MITITVEFPESDNRKVRRIGQSLEALIAEAMNMTGRTRVYVGMEVEADTPAPAAPKVRAPRKSSAPAETAPASSFVADQAALEPPVTGPHHAEAAKP